MHSNMKFLSKLKLHKKKISKCVTSCLEKFQSEFIEHTIGFVCLTSIITMARAAQNSNPLSLLFIYLFIYLSEKLKSSVLTAQTGRHFSNWKNIKFIDSRSNSVTTVQKIMNKLLKKTRVSITYLQLKFDEI